MEIPMQILLSASFEIPSDQLSLTMKDYPEYSVYCTCVCPSDMNAYPQRWNSLLCSSIPLSSGWNRASLGLRYAIQMQPTLRR